MMLKKKVGMPNVLYSRPREKIVGRINHEDFERALVQAMLIVNDLEKDGTLKEIIASWVEVDPVRAFLWLQSPGNESLKMSLMYTAIYQISKTDPIKGLQYMNLIPDSLEKKSLLKEICKKVAEQNPAMARKLVSDIESGLYKTDILADIARVIAKTDISMATAIIEELPFGNARNGLITDIAASWSKFDLTASLAWINSLDSSDQLMAYSKVSLVWAETSPQEAAEFFARYEGKTRKTYLDKVMSVWVKSDPVGAISWIDKSGFDFDNKAARAAYSYWGIHDPLAASLSANQIVDETKREALLPAIVGGWVMKDPIAASKYVQLLPDDNAKAKAIQYLVSDWAHLDSVSASKWVIQLDDGPNKDQGVIALAFAIVQSDPKSAFEWSLQITEPTDRAKWIKTIGSQWIKSQGDGVISQMKTMGVSSTEINMIK